MQRPLYSTDRLVLGTVNASWKWEIDAGTLAAIIQTGETDEWLCHLATFFSEVSASLILDFAEGHGIDMATLATSYAKVKSLTNEFNTDLEASFAAMG